MDSLNMTDPVRQAMDLNKVANLQLHPPEILWFFWVLYILLITPVINTSFWILCTIMMPSHHNNKRSFGMISTY